MMGMAQQLFLEGKERPSVNKVTAWPTLEGLLAAKCLHDVDIALASRLVGPSSQMEALAALICHLSLAVRQGHLCVKIDGRSIVPSPEEIWEAQEEIDFSACKALILQGAGDIESVKAFVHKNGHCYYLQRYWHLETMLLDHLKSFLLHETPLFPLDLGAVTSAVDALIQQGKLQPEQGRAVVQAASSPLTLITGGPGTGKTYTAGIFLSTVWEAMALEQREHCKIALAAPTGKAAANLEGSIQKVWRGTPGIKAQTLHQLLGIQRSGIVKRDRVLSADIILVDESSMIDVTLMGHLLKAVKPGARLILIGDKSQLPSVEAGSLFADLVTCLSSKTAVVELKTCLRTESSDIIELAEEIKAGNSGKMVRWLESSAAVHVVVIDEGMPPKEQQRRLVKRVLPHFSQFPTDPLEVLGALSRFRVLSPMRKGLFGVDQLNQSISQAIASKAGHGQIVPIMIVQNDYRLELFNGEVGVLVKEKNGSPFAVFPSREPGKKVRKIPLLLLPRFDLAFCLSVHKSQGSEFDSVVLVLPEGAQLFGREAFYTGVTRARRSLEIWSHPDVWKETIKRTALRQSGMIERLDIP